MPRHWSCKLWRWADIQSNTRGPTLQGGWEWPTEATLHIASASQCRWPLYKNKDLECPVWDKPIRLSCFASIGRKPPWLSVRRFWMVGLPTGLWWRETWTESSCWRTFPPNRGRHGTVLWSKSSVVQWSKFPLFSSVTWKRELMSLVPG